MKDVTEIIHVKGNFPMKRAQPEEIWSKCQTKLEQKIQF